MYEQDWLHCPAKVNSSYFGQLQCMTRTIFDVQQGYTHHIMANSSVWPGLASMHSNTMCIKQWHIAMYDQDWLWCVAMVHTSYNGKYWCLTQTGFNAQQWYAPHTIVSSDMWPRLASMLSSGISIIQWWLVLFHQNFLQCTAMLCMYIIQWLLVMSDQDWL